MSVQNMNIFAVVRSASTAKDLGRAATGINGHKIDVQVGSLESLPDSGHGIGQPNLLLLEVDANNDRDVALLDQVVRRKYPNTPVIATAPDMTLQSVRRLMRHGVVDVLPQPILPEELMTAVSHATRAILNSVAGHRSEGKVISFIKGGGGAGATTVAVQAGCLIGSQTDAQQNRVALIDLDIQFGTAALYLDLNNDLNISDLIDAGSHLDGPMLRDVAQHHESGLDVIPAPPQVMPLDAIAPDFVATCLDVACQEYSIVLLDLPDAWTAWSFAALKRSDLIVLVTQLSVAGIRQSKQQLDTLAAQGLEDVPVKVVLNRFTKSWGDTISINEARNALGRPVDYRIVNDYRVVSEALNQGLALGKIKKRSKVEKSLQVLIDDAIEPILESER